MYLSAKVHAKQSVPYRQRGGDAADVPTRQEVHAKQSLPIAKRQRERCIISDQWSRVSEGGNDSANECH